MANPPASEDRAGSDSPVTRGTVFNISTSCEPDTIPNIAQTENTWRRRKARTRHAVDEIDERLLERCQRHGDRRDIPAWDNGRRNHADLCGGDKSEGDRLCTHSDVLDVGSGAAQVRAHHCNNITAIDVGGGRNQSVHSKRS